MSQVKKAAVLTGLTMLAGGVETSQAATAEITQTDTFNLTVAGIPPTILPNPGTTNLMPAFQQFDPSKGTLTGVTFSLSSEFISVPSGFGVSGFTASLGVPGQTLFSFLGTGANQSWDFTDQPGEIGIIGDSFYKGTGSFTVSANLNCTSCEGGLGWVGDNSAPDASLTLTYDYTPTPIPSALPLFATGLAGLGLGAWRRRKQNRA
jgi:hypothetical protein